MICLFRSLWPYLDNKGATCIHISIFYFMHCALQKSALHRNGIRSNILLLGKLLGHHILRKVRINCRNKHLNLIYICLWINLNLQLMWVHWTFSILITNTSVKLMKTQWENRTLKSPLFFLLKQFFHFSHFIFWINSIAMRLMWKTNLSSSPKIVEK